MCSPSASTHERSSSPAASERSASTPGRPLLITGVLLAAGLAASLAAGRLRMPGLVLVLGLGMVIGSDGLGWIDFADFKLARQAGIVALALILFEGGLSSGFAE